jgi:hypothetical protein
MTTHWEWRAFGSVSPAFLTRFDNLSAPFGRSMQRVVDEYLWIPGLEVNVKFRQGTNWQDGLKFKRFERRSGELEKWTESMEEIFPFPLSDRAWALLLAELKIPAAAQMTPPRAADRDGALKFLQLIEPRTRLVAVIKERRFRMWHGGRNVRLELAEVVSPRKTTSVGFEVWDPMERLDDAASMALWERAISAMGIREEAVRPMNYLEYMKSST